MSQSARDEGDNLTTLIRRQSEPQLHRNSSSGTGYNRTRQHRYEYDCRSRARRGNEEVIRTVTGTAATPAAQAIAIRLIILVNCIVLSYDQLGRSYSDWGTYQHDTIEFIDS